MLIWTLLHVVTYVVTLLDTVDDLLIVVTLFGIYVPLLIVDLHLVPLFTFD